MNESSADLRRVRAQRLAAQCITAPAASVEAAARRLLGIQAQDLTQARWALGVRTANARAPSVREALSSGRLVRTWSMRGTLHVVAAEDLRWLIPLLAPRNVARAALRRRQLEIDDRDVAEVRAVAERHLAGGGLSRAELFLRFEEAGQRTSAQRGLHLLFCLSQAGVICQAGDAFVLTHSLPPGGADLSGDAALFELARRYREGHGPCEAGDLAFWAGIRRRDAGRALDMAGRMECPEAPVPRAVLLPGYDEYLLGYANRDASIDPRHAALVVPGQNGVYQPMVLLDGAIRGTWRAVDEGARKIISVRLFVSPARWRDHLETAANAYATFTGAASELRVEQAR